jgi:hypothetical protein
MIRVKYSKYSKELIYLRQIYSLPFLNLKKLCLDYSLAQTIKYKDDCILDSKKVALEIENIQNHCNNLHNFLCVTPVNTEYYKRFMLDFIDSSPLVLFKASINSKVWRNKTKYKHIDLDFLREEHTNLFEIYQLLNIEI